jgi:hypothetical protein
MRCKPLSCHPWHSHWSSGLFLCFSSSRHCYSGFSSLPIMSARRLSQAIVDERSKLVLRELSKLRPTRYGRKSRRREKRVTRIATMMMKTPSLLSNDSQHYQCLIVRLQSRIASCLATDRSLLFRDILLNLRPPVEKTTHHFLGYHYRVPKRHPLHIQPTHLL